MVLQKAQKAVDNLKEKPEEDKKTIAGGVAISVVIILLIGWGILFFNKIQRGDDLQFESIVPEEFRNTSFDEAQSQLLEGYAGFDELRTVRDQILEQYTPAEVQDTSYQYSGTNQFGQPNVSE